MSKARNHLWTPRLRFPEFRDAGDWDTKPLREVANVFQGYGFPEHLQGKAEGQYPFYKVSDISNASESGSRFIEQAANYVDRNEIDLLKAKTIPKGTTIFAKIGEAIRSNRRVKTTSECIIDNNTAGVKAINAASVDDFVFYLMSRISLIDYAGGAVPSVNRTTIENIVTSVPPVVKEQRKIASCLSSLDQLVFAQSQKLDALKDYKKGLMQQLFPKEGGAFPRLRFPEFQEAGKWVGQNLRDILTLNYGMSLHVEDREQGEIPVYGSNGIVGTHSKAAVHQPGIIIGRKGSAGLVHMSRKPFFPIDTTFYLTADDAPEVDLHFLYHLLRHVDLKRITDDGNVPGLNRKIAYMESAHIPELRIEQEKIAACLSSLDELISAQSLRLDTLRIHKKGLLQQLFPASDESLK